MLIYKNVNYSYNLIEIGSDLIDNYHLKNDDILCVTVKKTEFCRN